jgi:hypothetical protein
MTTRAAVQIVVAGVVAAAALATAVAAPANHSQPGTVRAQKTQAPGLIVTPPGDPVVTDPACPNCFG